MFALQSQDLCAHLGPSVITTAMTLQPPRSVHYMRAAVINGNMKSAVPENPQGLYSVISFKRISECPGDRGPDMTQ